MQRQISEGAMRVYLFHLSKYEIDQVISALLRCQVELKHFPTIAEICERLSDGRPGAEEAWGMIPKDEYSSVVWSEEMRQAFGKCYSLLQDGEKIAARMTFKESYEELVSKNRALGVPVRWLPTRGTDRSGVATALLEAVEQQRIPIQAAIEWMPEIEQYAPSSPLLKAPEARLALGYPPDLKAVQGNVDRVKELAASIPKKIE
jgi:hypothetical protein